MANRRCPSGGGREFGRRGRPRDGLEALATSGRLEKLLNLYLDDNGVGKSGAEALATTEVLDAFVAIGLFQNPVGDAGRRALETADAIRCRRVTGLELGCGPIVVA